MLDGAIAGLVSGSATAILAVCLVMLVRLTGVLNLAQAALGALGAFIVYDLTAAGLPLLLALLAGLVLAAVLAVAAGWVLTRWFSGADPITRTVVPSVLLIVLLTLGFRLFGDAPRVMPSLVPEVGFAVGGVRVSLTTVAALALALAISVGLTVLLRRTRLGLRLQAMSERPTDVQLLGVDTRVLAIGAWAVTGALSALALLLIAPTRTPTFEAMALLVVPALAAALLGRFRSVGVAVGAGLAIGALEGVGARIDAVASVRGAIPFVLILIALIWVRRREVWDELR